MLTDNTLELERALRAHQRAALNAARTTIETNADILALALALAPKGDPAVKERPFLQGESPAAYRRRVNGGTV